MLGFENLLLAILFMSISMLGVSIGFLIGFNKSGDIYEKHVSEINRINDEYSKSVLESAINSIESIASGNIKEFSEAIIETEKILNKNIQKTQESGEIGKYY